MFRSNLQNSSIESKTNERKPYNYVDIPNNINLELYPRKRKTEYYFEPAPPVEFQSREAEFPHKVIEVFKSKQQTSNDEVVNTKIYPPTCSTTRMTRDSYFS